MIKPLILTGFSWNTALSIFLFLIALGVLVTIHEFGHFIAAKSFKVYCQDFSIGYGPKIIKIKRKKGETTFSVGVLPLGGYVSMLGDEDAEALPEGVNVPFERTLAGVKRYKRIIIMSAGIIMNFILAFVIFLICASCFPQIQANAWYDVKDDASFVSLDVNNKLGNNDQFIAKAIAYYDDNGTKRFRLYDKNLDANNPYVLNVISSDLFYEEKDTEKKIPYIATISYSLAGGVNDTDISKNIFLYQADLESNLGDKLYAPKINEAGKAVNYNYKNGDVFNIPLNYVHATDSTLKENYQPTYTKDEEGKAIAYDGTLNLKSESERFAPVNISFYKYSYWLGWKSFSVAGKNWVTSTTLISEALGKMFIGQGWDQVGGPLAIFSQTTSILENNPFYFYLQTWGMISVNLALFNLLPFPGLDGWQILVELVEGSVNGIKKSLYRNKKRKEKGNSTEKAVESNSESDVTINKEANLTIGKNTNENYKEWQIPAKVKTIMSYIGLGLLFAFMIVIFIKDIIGMF